MNDARRARARRALDGLSVGDAFGEGVFSVPPALRAERIAQRVLPRSLDRVWPTTDDTEMAMALVQVLDARGTVDPDDLAEAFVARYLRDPARGYGGTARVVLEAIAQGVRWEVASPLVHNGEGSKGNGGAMRAAVVGAWFAEDDPAVVRGEAVRSAVVTHAHRDGQEGAVAVALAAQWAWRFANVAGFREAEWSLLGYVAARLEEGPVRDGVRKAAGAGAMRGREAAAMLGSGQRVLAEDTVPFALWCASVEAYDFEAAMWLTAEGGGDVDTTCAIVGGVVALSAPTATLPFAWVEAREGLRW